MSGLHCRAGAWGSHFLRAILIAQLGSLSLLIKEAIVDGGPSLHYLFLL